MYDTVVYPYKGSYPYIRLGANKKCRTILVLIRNMCVYFCVLFPHMSLSLHRLGLGMTTLSLHLFIHRFLFLHRLQAIVKLFHRLGMYM